MSTISTTAVADELKKYVKVNKKPLSLSLHKSTGSPLDMYCKTISKVKGEFPQFHAVLGHVVQGFTAQWTPMGKAQFIAKTLKNYRQKVNYPIVPDEIYGTYLGDMYEEGTELKKMPISKWIIQKELLPKVAEDVEHLSMDATYDNTRLNEYGYSMQGFNQTITAGRANTDNPFFKLPTPVPTRVNILDAVDQFELNMPRKAKRKGKCKYIFMSDTNADFYDLAYIDKYGDNNIVGKDTRKTVVGKRKIVGLPWLNDDTIFTTLDGNLAKLIDVTNPAKIDKIMEGEYDIKVLMEFHLGYDFLINEIVFISDPGTVRGLGSAEKMELYYPKESVTSLV